MPKRAKQLGPRKIELIGVCGVANLASSPDSIVAVSTGSNRAALSIVRLSGPRVPEIARRLLVPFPEETRRATLTTARDPGGITLDQLIAVRYDAPRSYTGEAMLELSCHGGRATSSALLRACLALGARMAHPGEFTRRALLNGKLDLVQAEAVADLIDASSEPMRRVALGVVGGGLSRRVAELRNALLQLEAVMAYSVDFPEEDEEEASREQILLMAVGVSGRVTDLLETADRGSIIRDGALIVFAGPPNVGKSSLFNALLGQERAIVTDIPGTTRDAIEHPCMIGDWPVRLVDTAGLRSSLDIVERLGIEVSERYVKDAEICIVCSDGQRLSVEEIAQTIKRLGAGTTIAVETKLDIRTAERHGDTPIWVSAATGEGLAALRAAIVLALERHYGAIDYENPTITRARHAAMLRQASDELLLFITSMQAATTPTIAAVHLRAAVVALEEIIGAVSVDDLLDEVFSRFCVGK